MISRDSPEMMTAFHRTDILLILTVISPRTTSLLMQLVYNHVHKPIIPLICLAT